VRLVRLIRYRYPYTTGMVLYVMLASAMLPFTPARKWGEVMLAVLAFGILSFIARRMDGKRRSG
jgi:hypothetical protein